MKDFLYHACKYKGKSVTGKHIKDTDFEGFIDTG